MRVLRFAPLVVIAATLGGVLVAAQQAQLPPKPAAPAPAAVPPAMVSLQEIAAGLPADGSRWLHFGGNYSNHRHSPLTQITPDNVNRLRPAVDVPDRRRSATSRRRRSFATTSSTSPARRTSRGRSTRAPAGRSGATAASCRTA